MQKTIKIDWLSFTTRRNLATVLAHFETLLNPLKAVEKGLYGYTSSAVSADGVTVLWSAGRDDIHVQMTGKFCEADFRSLLVHVDKADKISRLDIAVDCHNSGFTCSDVWGYLQQGKFIASSSNFRRFSNLDKRKGETVYLGSPSSERMLRIYDKGAESGKGGDWVRYEIQLRSSQANTFYRDCVEMGTINESTAGILLSMLRLVQDTPKRVEKLKSEGNQSRLKLITFWSELTDFSEPLSLHVPRLQASISSTLRYVKNAAAAIKSLMVMPDFEDFFNDIIKSAKLNNKYKLLQDEIMNCFTPVDYNFRPMISPVYA